MHFLPLLDIFAWDGRSRVTNAIFFHISPPSRTRVSRADAGLPHLLVLSRGKSGASTTRARCARSTTAAAALHLARIKRGTGGGELATVSTSSIASLPLDGFRFPTWKVGKSPPSAIRPLVASVRNAPPQQHESHCRQCPVFLFPCFHL